MPLPGRERRRSRRAERRRRRRGEPEPWNRMDADPDMIIPWDINRAIRYKEEKEQPILANKGGLMKSGVSRYKDIHDMENGG